MVARAPRAKAITKKNGVEKNGSTRKKDQQVITLRIGKPQKSRLLAHCHRLSKERGKQVSFNAAIIEMIESL